MKNSLALSQYEQLAKEQFLKMFNDIPFVSDVEFFKDTTMIKSWDFYAIVHFVGQEKTTKFYGEIKSNGEKRFVNMFIDAVRKYNDKENCYIFIAPYVSEASAQELIKNEYSYMDLSGNCYILTDRIFLNISGKPNQYISKREKKNYLIKSSSAASTIIRTMLDMPDKEWQVLTLSEATGKALGTVSNVKSFLRDREWLNEGQNGFKIVNVRELLHNWAKDYHSIEDQIFEYYSFDSIAEIESEISKWSATHDNAAVLGSFSAASRYAPVVRYNKVNVYVNQQCLKEFTLDLDLQPVASGGNVIVTIPHDETPCLFSRKMLGSLVTSPVQTIIDLLGNSARGEEAAVAIITKEYEGNDSHEG